MNYIKDDLDQCHKEPIHIPGLIQPFGALISFSHDFRISHYSENFHHYFGTSSTMKSGAELQHVLGSENASLSKQKIKKMVSFEEPFVLSSAPCGLHGPRLD
jgi:light-regulated signal transduction histidine kinase (bacteriophytochrome)